MTIEEAIKKLQRHKVEYLDEWVDFSGIAEALDMAIKALQLLDKADEIITKQLDIIDKLEEMTDISYDQVESRTLRRILDKISGGGRMTYCSDCIHYKVCGNEGVDDVSMTFCADKQTDENLISCLNGWNKVYKYILEDIKQVSSAENTAEWIFYIADNDGNDGKEEKWCKCSKCGYKEFYLPQKRHICPNCGRRMKGEYE